MAGPLTWAALVLVGFGLARGVVQVPAEVWWSALGLGMMALGGLLVFAGVRGLRARAAEREARWQAFDLERAGWHHHPPR